MPYRYDLHLHTTVSFDGSITPAQLVSACRTLGLSGAAITDHDALDLDYIARCEELDEELVFVPGVEATSTDNKQLIGLGPGLTDWPLSMYTSTLDEILDALHEADALIVAPHPFASVERYPAIGEAIYDYMDEIEAIEVTNPKTYIDNKRARKVAKQFNKRVVGGSDAHEASGLGLGYTILERRAEDAADLVRMIREEGSGAELAR